MISIHFFWKDFKKQAKENVFIANNKKYFPMVKDINGRLEEIKLIDIKAISSIEESTIKNANSSILADKFESNEYDIQLILDSLIAPGKDIRSEKEGLILKTDVLEFKDIKEEMTLEGTVQNITDFGAFIYIGIKEAALIHISNLSDKFVSHPSDIVKTGERVALQIISIDRERKRIQGKLIGK